MTHRLDTSLETLEAIMLRFTNDVERAAKNAPDGSIWKEVYEAQTLQYRRIAEIIREKIDAEEASKTKKHFTINVFDLFHISKWNRIPKAF